MLSDFLNTLRELVNVLLNALGRGLPSLPL
jgi:hypothetical protein